ncbi:MAG: outer membrane protein transport protein [Gammaproteobacteria bacterium]|nr:outer membrane protein transport protein [Gammaproteobacteria bacterium]
MDVDYTGSATVDIFGFPYTQPVDNASGDTLNAVPNFQYALPLPKGFAFSFGVTTPFGLSTNYNDVSPINLLATETQLETVNLNPGLAYEINRYLSIGAGFDALYGSAIYDTNTYTGDLVTNDLTGWNYGYNVGALVQFTPETRAGLSYRSAITVDAKGPSSSSLFGLPRNSTASAEFPLPATSIFSVYHDFNSRFALMGSAFYTQWSCFNQLVLNNVSTPLGQGTIAINEKYRNTWNLALGGKYKITKQVSIEAGFGHDQTPTSLNYRDIRLPDNNRYAASLGINIDPSPGFHWSMGWTHFFVPSTPINNSDSNDASKTTSGFEPGVSVGTETGNINVLGIQFSCDI